MKVLAHVNTEVSIEVDPCDVIDQLPDLEHNPDSIPSILSLISRCLEGLRAVPDAVISALPAKARPVIIERLKMQLARYEGIEIARAQLDIVQEREAE